MYRVDFDQNVIEALKTETFSNLGFSERSHLQEWIAAYPEALGEKLLILQKEFSGFQGTNERLDLLALDQDGNLVIIENKLDDSGRDVVWQALKYASYCASLTSQEICQIYQSYLDQLNENRIARDQIATFLELEEGEDLVLNQGSSQRIMLIAAQFRKEVTSTVLWLMNFNLQIKCFKATPYQLEDQVLLNLEPIIPIPDALEYTIRMAEKTSQETKSAKKASQVDTLYHQFWTQLLQEMNDESHLFRSISPKKKSYISKSSGYKGLGWSFNLTNKSCRAQLYIEREDPVENQQIFEQLKQKKEMIENQVGSCLEWVPMEGAKACRIVSMVTTDLFDESSWAKTIESMVKTMSKLEKTFSPLLAEITNQ